MDLCDADTELASQFVAGEKALITQTIGPAFQPVQAAHVTHPLRRERIAFPICKTKCIELLCRLTIRAALQEFIEFLDHRGARLATSAIGMDRGMLKETVCPPRKRTWIAMSLSLSRVASSINSASIRLRSSGAVRELFQTRGKSRASARIRARASSFRSTLSAARR
jgi:hypothetical protein